MRSNITLEEKITTKGIRRCLQFQTNTYNSMNEIATFQLKTLFRGPKTNISFKLAQFRRKNVLFQLSQAPQWHSATAMGNLSQGPTPTIGILCPATLQSPHPNQQNYLLCRNRSVDKQPPALIRFLLAAIRTYQPLVIRYAEKARREVEKEIHLLWIQLL